MLHLPFSDLPAAKQAFQMIFTSPSSASGNIDATEAPVNPPPYGRHRKGPSKRPPVATKLGMGGRVTARAIAYAAVVVCHSCC